MPSMTRRRFLRDTLAAVVGVATSPAPTSRTAAIHALCRGYVSRTKGELAMALAYFTDAIRLHPDFTLAQTERAVLLDELGHCEQATLEHERTFRLLTEIAQEGGQRRQP